MTNATSLPRSIEDVPPGPGYVRLPLQNAKHGRPEGFHSGGPFYHPDDPDEIWKPLDARPHAGDDYAERYATDEATALNALGDLPSFRRNSRVVEQNGRVWLVRERAQSIAAYGMVYLDHDELAQLEADLREANRRGWEINDHINVMRDPDSYTPFFLDLSAAQWRNPNASGAFRASDEHWWLRALEEWNFTYTLTMRQASIDECRDLPDAERFMLAHERRYRYLSYNRPFSLTWAQQPDNNPITVVPRESNQSGVRGYTWVCAQRALDPAYCTRYELALASRPWHETEEDTNGDD